MKKLTIRARAPDPAQPMPIYMDEELPELQDYSSVNRALPKMPSGMQEEEEAEHHLQRAIDKGAIIPTPQVINVTDVKTYDEIYTEECKLPPKLIRLQPFLMEQDEYPEYDLDTEDEEWVNSQEGLTPLQFEEIIDRLEKSYNPNSFVFDVNKAYLKEEDDISRAVFEYWLNKRNKTQRPLMPKVKTEKYDRSGKNIDPYVVFRKHSYGQIRTRKIRKNDETCYEKILNIRNNLNRVKTLLDMIKSRENLKKEKLYLTLDVYEKRYEAEDFDGTIIADIISRNPPKPRPRLVIPPPTVKNQILSYLSNKACEKENHIYRNDSKQIKKRKHKSTVGPTVILGRQFNNSDSDSQVLPSSTGSASDCYDSAEEDEYAFHRNNHSAYLPPVSSGIGNWPWCDKSEGGSADKKYRFSLTSINKPKPKCIGFARRRRGRGGRVILDRYSDKDDFWSSLDFTVHESKHEASTSSSSDILHFRPVVEESPSEDYSNYPEVEETQETQYPQYPFPSEAESICIDIESEHVNTSPYYSVEFNVSDYFSLDSLSDFDLITMGS